MKNMLKQTAEMKKKVEKMILEAKSINERLVRRIGKPVIHEGLS